MKNTLAVSLVTLLSVGAMAQAGGRIVLTGAGTAAAPPDFVAMGISITSVCYLTEPALRTANATMVNQVRGVLAQHLAPNEQERVRVEVGTSEQGSFYRSNARNDDDRCNGWITRTQIMIEQAPVEKIGPIRAAVGALAPATSSLRSQGQTQDPATLITMGRPQGRLSAETRGRLRAQARVNAAADYEQELDALIAMCGISNPQIREITVNPDRSGLMRASPMPAFAPESGISHGTDSINLNLPEISVETTLQVVVDFSGAANTRCNTRR